MMRQSNFELLRLILMVMIIIHHGIVFGLGYVGWSSCVDSQLNPIFSIGGAIVATVNSICIIAVNTFILLSGYFGIYYKTDKILKLLIITFLYTVIFTTIYEIGIGNIKNGIVSLFFISHTKYWFIKYYLVLIFIAPMLNSLFIEEKLSAAYRILLVLLFISMYLGFVWGDNVNRDGYTLIQFILMYLIGRYIAVKQISYSKVKSFLLFLLPSLLNSLIIILLWSKGDVSLGWRCTYYNNPLVIMGAIGFFMYFKNFSIKSNLINNVSKHTLGIYLFHCSASISSLLYFIVGTFYMYSESYLLTLCVIVLCSIVILLFSIYVDRYFSSVSNYLIKKGLSRFKKN